MQPRLSQRGATMIEVLVTVVIIAFGLLGMAGLQMRLQISEMESYQRSQALLLLNDMASRIATNRTAATAGNYVTGDTYGSGMVCPAANATVVERDLKEWCEALQGASETQDGNKVAVVVGGRGCVHAIDGDYVVTVAWQGMTAISAPPVLLTCGAGEYNSSSCANDLCRRVVTTVVRIATLI